MCCKIFLKACVQILHQETRRKTAIVKGFKKDNRYIIVKECAVHAILRALSVNVEQTRAMSEMQYCFDIRCRLEHSV